jgi:hypothetical protein
MKKKNQKLTGKQVEYNLARLYQEQGQLGQIINSIGNMVVEYIEYKGDKDGFAEHSTKKEEAARKQQESKET